MNGRVLSLAAILSFLGMLPIAALAEGHHAPVMVHARAAQGQPTPGPIPPGAPQPGPVTGPRDNEQKPETGTGRIAGRVIGGEAATPLRRAEVRLGGEGLREGRSTSTDESGRFEFKDLPKGRFQLHASKAGYVTMAYGQRRPTESGRPIELADGQRMDGVQFNLPRGGVVTGRITDEFGEAVAGLEVRVLRHSYFEGRRQLVPVSQAGTDDLGRYRAYGLPPGDYLVSASSGMGGISWGAQSESRSGFAPTYYPGTPSAADAQRVRVSVGSEVTANFALLPTRTLRVSGTATDSEGKPIANGVVMVQEGQGGRQPTFTMIAGGMIKPDGTFSLNTLTPGEYVLHVNKEGGFDDEDNETAAVPVVLTTDDVTGLSIVTSRPAKLAGQIVFERGQPPPFKPTEVGMWAIPVEQRSSMFGGPIKTRDDWTFEGTAQDSPALLRGRIDQSDWRIRTVLQRGVDVTDTGIVFRPGEVVDDLQVILTNRVSRIIGTVTTDRGGPAKEYAVVIYAGDPDRWGPMTRYIESARPDQQGQFEIKGLPPGNYLALAVEYLEEGQDRDPEFLQHMRPYATNVQLDDAERKVLTLRVVADR
jgi:hypothetical protein